ncbi:MAG: phosphoadenosine phosphosulfate reductase family protein [Actinomycetia bacterium]|nr:phosphoadenosine phosphosulfate reductase family protein [Actinomycetes bacterium]
MLSHVVNFARAAGVIERLVALHVDLGRMEWAGTTKLAVAQADFFDVPIYITRKGGYLARAIIRGAGDVERQQLIADGTTKSETATDLLDRVRERGAANPHRPAWPSAAARWCTSDFKRGPARRFFTWLAHQHRDHQALQRPVRILSAMGLRAEESRSRARRAAYKTATISTSVQQVDEWLPIHRWSTPDVWREIHSSGAPWHRAYDLGMSRLSCALCILASSRDLTIGARHNPGLAAEILAVEHETGYTFLPDRSIAAFID